MQLMREINADIVGLMKLGLAEDSGISWKRRDP
jgi:hypothetical protein